MNRLPLPLACLLFCIVSVIAKGKEPRPLDQLSSTERQAYNSALQQYRKAEREQAKILQDLRRADPALERAAYWLDNEHLTANTQFRFLDKAFTATLNPDAKRKYRQWVLGYSTRVHRQTLDKEWNNVPAGRPALLFLAEQEIKRQKELAGNRKPKGPKDAQEAAAILDLKGSDSEKWTQYQNWSRQQNKRFVDEADALDRQLGIPNKLKSELHRQAVDSALFLLYDSYCRLHLPPTLTTLQKQLIASVNELNKLRPGWEAAEGIESPAAARERK
jgi:hypothetical protein